MGKKIKHFFDPAEEFLKSQQEALRMATANPLEELSEKIFKDLLKPINYLEEQVKAMNIAALGKDYLVVFLK